MRESVKVQERGQKHPRYAMSGALLNGIDGSMDLDQSINGNSNLKRKAKYD